MFLFLLALEAVCAFGLTDFGFQRGIQTVAEELQHVRPFLDSWSSTLQSFGFSPDGLLQSVTTCSQWSGDCCAVCCCHSQWHWALWVITVLSADWRRTVSALTPHPFFFFSLCISLYCSAALFWVGLSPPPLLLHFMFLLDLTWKQMILVMLLIYL